jgi:WD40 repeat protein
VASPDGKVIATVHSDGVVRFWAGPDGAAPSLVADLAAEKGGELYAAAFSPDGTLFATAGAAGVVTIVDTSDPTQPVAWSEPLVGPASAVQDLTFSANGRTLYAATSDPGLYRWVLQDGEQAAPMRPITRFGGSVQSVATSSTALLATGSADGLVRVWKLRPKGLIPLYRLSVGASTNFVNSVAFSPDGRLLAAGTKDKRVRVWDTATGSLVTDELGGFTAWVNSVAFSDDGHSLAAAASGGLVRTWNTGTWAPEQSLSGPTNFTSVQFVPGENRLVTGSMDGAARVYYLDGPPLPIFGDNIWGLAAPKSGTPIYVGVGSDDPRIVPAGITDPLDLRFGPALRGPESEGESAGALDGVVGVSPDGTILAAGTAAGHVVVWSMSGSRQAEQVADLHTATQLIENIAFSADGKTFAASSDDGSTTIYALHGSDVPLQLARLQIDTLAMGVAVSPDSSLVAVGGADNQVHLWSLDGSHTEPITSLEGFDNYVPAAAFSPDGRTLAAGSADGNVRLWDVTSPGSPAPLGKPLVGALDTVFGLAFDPSGERLAAASADGTLWLWSLDKDGAALYARLGNLGGGVYQALFHPSGRVVGGGASGRVTSWSTDVADAEKQICRIAGTPISKDEWAQHVPGVEYDPPCA